MVAVHDVNLHLPPGSRRALLGPNGAGKTTLFNLIAGDVQPDEGQILLFGVDVTHENGRRRVSRGLGRTYQRSKTFGGLTVEGNVELALLGAEGGVWTMRFRGSKREARLGRAAALVGQVGLSAKLREPAGSLSHGEHRQLELAMGLAGSPRLLILDEPAAGLSPSERGTLTDLLLGLDRSLTVLLIEHDMNIALKVADAVTVMADGRVVFDGTPDEIRSSTKVHDIYLGNVHV